MGKGRKERAGIGKGGGRPPLALYKSRKGWVCLERTGRSKGSR